MSTPAAAGLGSSLPVVNAALEPASVRNGSPATKQACAAALAFENLLVDQLTQQLASSTDLMGSASSGSGADAGSSSDPASSELASLLPQALSATIMGGGGLGIAATMMSALTPTTGSVGAGGSIGAGGGTTAPTGSAGA